LVFEGDLACFSGGLCGELGIFRLGLGYMVQDLKYRSRGVVETRIGWLGVLAFPWGLDSLNQRWVNPQLHNYAELIIT
jgi:hypothetical protein